MMTAISTVSSNFQSLSKPSVFYCNGTDTIALTRRLICWTRLAIAQFTELTQDLLADDVPKEDLIDETVFILCMPTADVQI